VEIVRGKISQKPEVLNPWKLLNRNFLRRTSIIPMVARKIPRLKYFPNCFWTVWRRSAWNSNKGTGYKAGVRRGQCGI
jgi:hypothetical protein